MRTAIVTGASRGLGRALARDLSAAGWHLVIDARGAEDLDAVARTLPAPGRVTALAGDVTDPWHREALVDAAAGHLGLLVLNASSLGTSPLPPLARYDLEALRALYEVNVVAQLALVQQALPALRQSEGRILAITSDASVEGYEGWGGYGSSKAALDQVVRVLAVEEPSLRVYSADPGDMRTRMHQDAFPGEDISDRPEPEESVPALRRLVDGDLPSGRYTVSALGAR